MGQCFSPTSRGKQNAHEAYTRRSERSLHFRKLPLHTHSILKDYEVTKKVIGTGASGPIRLIKRRSNEEKYALKILLDGPAARREVELQFLACQHPNVVRIVDVYENLFRNSRCLFMVMEYMSGGQLLERLKTERIQISERDVLRIIRDLGSAIAYIHSLGIIHRDIKPENVMYSKNGMLKLNDFGFAIMEKEQPNATPSTSYYPPSEVVQSTHCDRSCDMWSLGVLMYFLLCGYPPYFSNQEEDFSESTQQKIISGEYLFPADQWDKVSLQAKSIVRRLLAADSEKRMSADELMGESWIVRCSRALDTPLCTADFLNDEKYLDVQDVMREHLTGIRAINKQVQIKPLNDAINPILMRRRETKFTDADSISNTPTPASTIPPCPTPCTLSA